MTEHVHDDPYTCSCGWDAVSEFYANLIRKLRVREYPPQELNHPSHVFASTWDDDCIRCMACEMLYGGLQSGQPCRGL